MEDSITNDSKVDFPEHSPSCLQQSERSIKTPPISLHFLNAFQTSNEKPQEKSTMHHLESFEDYFSRAMSYSLKEQEEFTGKEKNRRIKLIRNKIGNNQQESSENKPKSVVFAEQKNSYVFI